MSNFKKLLKTICEADGAIPEDEFSLPIEDDFTGEVDTEELPPEEITDEEPVTDEEAEILLGSAVIVQDAGSFTADELGLDEEDFEAFTTKVNDGESAIVFDIDDDDPSLVDIVFEDGLEIFKIAKVALKVTEMPE